MTPLMKADIIATEFNASTDRQYWTAHPGGSRGMPCVHFKSRSSMVKITYWVERERFTVEFSRTQCAFGDFMASLHRAMSQILSAMKATGFEIASPLDDKALLRVEYDAQTKQAFVAVASPETEWTQVQPLRFKAPESIFPQL